MKRAETQDRLIRMEPILNILRAALWSGKVSDEKPVSVMLIAEQESAKTEALKYFRGTPTIRYFSDITSRGIASYRTRIQEGTLKHIVILDLVRILSHGRGTSERTVQTLASLMEEGESEVSDAGGREEWKDFPRIGVLMGITPAFFKMKRGRWRQTGFLTRFVPVSFHYTDATVKEIHRAIANGAHTPGPHPEHIPHEAFTVNCNAAMSKLISLRAEMLGKQMRAYGFRYHRIMRALAKAQARIEGWGTVKPEHVEKIIEWSNLFTDKAVEL